jgi:hypothetical protein
MTEGSNRSTAMQALETDAELLVVCHLDLLAQVEAQLRAVHHTMRRIEKLRTARYRVGPELSNGQRSDTLVGLTSELDRLDEHLLTQHECCRDMQELVGKMQAVLSALKRAAGQLPTAASDATAGESEPPDSDGSVGAP